MTGAAVAAHLAQGGLDPAAVPATKALFDEALAGFGTVSSKAPEHAWWVPGRLEVFGKHTDYAGGRTLVAAVPRGFALLASSHRDESIHILDAVSGERAIFGAGKAAGTGWHHYADVVIGRLARNFPGVQGGARIVFASNLPRASGMSSSSALVVGLATALVRVWSLETRPEWRRNIPDLPARATFFAAIENGASFGTLEGDAGVGTHGGSEDHAAMLLGAAGAVSAFSFIPLNHLGDAGVPGEWRVVIASSGVTAEKTGGARDAYNRLSEGAAILLRLWNEERPPSRSLGAALASDSSAPEQLREIIRKREVPAWQVEHLERRLEHFRRENAIVLQALRAFRERDGAALSDLSTASQRDAEQLLGNQIPQTIGLVESARRCGAFGACSFGAGFGGGAWALVERDRAEPFRREWMDEYRRTYRVGSAEAFIATPGPALTELSSTGS